MKRVSIKDLATKAGVSATTVSLILNEKAKAVGISDSVIEKVQRVAEEMNYVPNTVARSLRTGKSDMIGLVVESISGHFFGNFAKVVEKQAEAAGYRVLYSSSENKLARATANLQFFSQHQVDGYLITPMPGLEKKILSLIAQGRPVVLVDSFFDHPEVSYFLVDNFKGMQLGSRHLLERGFRKIALITVDLKQIQIEERAKGFRQALSEEEAAESIELLLDYNADRETIKTKISDFISSHKPDALFFATNYLGTIGLEVIQEQSISLPDQLGMICFDDHDVFRVYDKGITVIRQPIDDIARSAVQCLLEQLDENNKSKPTQQLLEPALIVRGST